MIQKKKELSEEMSDYLPINVMNIIQKLVSKILANRLRWVLPDLISSSHTAFIQGKQITKNFNAIREMLHDISSSANRLASSKLTLQRRLI